MVPVEWINEIDITVQYQGRNHTLFLSTDKKVYFWKEGRSQKCGRTVWATHQPHHYLWEPDLYPPFLEKGLGTLRQQVTWQGSNVPRPWNNQTLEKLVYHLLQVTCDQEEQKDRMTWKNLRKPTIQDPDQRQLTTL